MLKDGMIISSVSHLFCLKVYPEEKVCSLCRCLSVIMNDDAMSCAACDASSGVYLSTHSVFRVRNSAQVLSYTLGSRRKLEHLFLWFDSLVCGSAWCLVSICVLCELRTSLPSLISAWGWRGEGTIVLELCLSFNNCWYCTSMANLGKWMEWSSLHVVDDERRGADVTVRTRLKSSLLPNWPHLW